MELQQTYSLSENEILEALQGFIKKKIDKTILDINIKLDASVDQDSNPYNFTCTFSIPIIKIA